MTRSHAGNLAFAAFLGFCIGVGAGIWIGCAQAGEADVRSMMERTEAVLIDEGFPADGYARTEPPQVAIVDDLPGRHWGAYQPGLVTLSRSQPEACLDVSLAHELAHDATVKMMLIDPGTPLRADEVKARYERIAEIVETRMASDGKWLPGCLLRRGLS